MIINSLTLYEKDQGLVRHGRGGIVGTMTLEQLGMKHSPSLGLRNALVWGGSIYLQANSLQNKKTNLKSRTSVMKSWLQCRMLNSIIRQDRIKES